MHIPETRLPKNAIPQPAGVVRSSPAGTSLVQQNRSTSIVHLLICMFRMNLHSLDPVGFRNWIQFLSDNPTQRCQHTNKPQQRQTQKAANNAVKQMNWSALRCILILTYFDTALLQMGCYRWAGKKRVCSFILSKSWEVYYEQYIWACNRKQLWFQNVSGQLFWPNTGALDKRFLWNRL